MNATVTNRRSPAAEEPIAAGFIEFLGGKLGRHAQIGTQHYWTPLRVLFLFAVLFLGLGYLSKANCLASVGPPGQALLDWSGNRQYTSACYTDIITSYGNYSHAFPYAGDLANAPEHPVLAVLFGWFMYWIAGGLSTIAAALGLSIAAPVVYFFVTAFTLSILWMITVRIIADLTGNRIWDTILLVCSPIVIVHAFTHWEILSVTAAVSALWFLSRNHYGYAGVCIGLGISAQIWPIVLLLALFMIAGRNETWMETLRCLEATILSWAAINLPIALLFPHNWFNFYVKSYMQMWDWQSCFTMLIRETNWIGFDHPTTLNLITTILFGIGFLAILILIYKAPSAPGVPEVTFLLLIVWMLSTKEWHPQYAMWFLPFIVLTAPKWRLVFIWGSIEALVWYIQMLHMLGKDNHGLPAGVLDLMLIIRGGLLLMLVCAVVRPMLNRNNTTRTPTTRRHRHRRRTEYPEPAASIMYV